MSERQPLNHDGIGEMATAMSLDQVDKQPNYGLSHVKRLSVWDDEKAYILHGINGSTEIFIHAGTGRGMFVFELATERGKLCLTPFANVGLKPFRNGKWCNWVWLEDPSRRIGTNN